MVLRDFAQRVEDGALGFTVKARGRLVEYQNRRTFKKGSGNGDALLFTAGKLQTTLAHQRVTSLRKRADKCVEMGEADGFLYLSIVGLGIAVANVLKNAVIEQDGVLGDDPDGLAQ